ncbi:Neuroparsin [Operophtera brumata]|uniref:Neuroparsin n=2 Tax=Operophtera brumata TaxID=104452 RepID=A0A0L7LFU7_OPEBR|nr:Neuroparsin [Operophtera brumata]
MLRSSQWVAMLAVLALVGASELNCICDPRECDVLEPSGCPGLGVIVWDPCKCCKVCARTFGEECGGFSGTCEPGLKCYEGSCTPIT